MSLVSTDCIKVYEGVQHFHNVWTAPLEAATIIALLLWRTGGAYGLPALGVVLVVLPLQYFFGYRIASYKMANVHVADARVLRMHEVQPGAGGGRRRTRTHSRAGRGAPLREAAGLWAPFPAALC